MFECCTYDYLSWVVAPRIIEYFVGGVYWGESRSYQNLVMSGTSPPLLLLIVSFFLFPNILQIFSYNRSFQHIQTPLHQRILKIEWVRGWKESLFRSARTSCRTFDSPPVRPSTRNNFSWVHRWAVTLTSGLRYPSNRIFSESWWCQLSKFGRKYKYKDKYRDKYKYRDK